MRSGFRHELSRRLVAWVDASDAAPPLGATEAAQQRLLARVHSARSRPGPVRAHWLAAASAAVLAIVVLALPLWTEQGTAFADVQAHLRDFRTLSMQVEQRHGDRVIQRSRTVVDARGVLRTDVGAELSVVVDPVRGRVLTLQHGPKHAMTMPLEQAAGGPDAALKWLAQIRNFKGQAQRLDSTRTIDGRVAHGWALDISGNRMVLWADRDGLPLAMENGGPGGLEIRYRFRFNVPLARGYLSSDVPGGYRLVDEDRL
ncbi:hypothetical protein [Cognatilysobacter bugurensis]|uniref:Uncharacterized protein n=1 Tax=Cognatilysobacter bugurensis TaxID=543356 RepID=A0A918T5W7_9GAMM|nr:hypothetical protein [Lysobacter bugurensis]GHA86414.1 hypothetical protein GCM10007067_25580 [Lysobacter bugurensis]